MLHTNRKYVTSFELERTILFESTASMNSTNLIGPSDRKLNKHLAEWRSRICRICDKSTRINDDIPTNCERTCRAHVLGSMSIRRKTRECVQRSNNSKDESGLNEEIAGRIED